MTVALLAFGVLACRVAGAQSFFWDLEGANGLSGWRLSTGAPLTTGPGAASSTAISVNTATGPSDSSVFLYHAVPFDQSKYYITNCFTRSQGSPLWPARMFKMAWVDTVTHQISLGGSSVSTSYSYPDWTFLENAQSQAYFGTGTYCVVIQLSSTAQATHWIDNVSVDMVPNTNVVTGALMWLGGCYDQGSGVMTEALRSAGLVPTTEPYSSLGYPQVAGGGGETCAPVLLSSIINQRGIDWVRIELRSAIDPAVLVATRQAIVDRFGAIRGSNAQSRLTFNVPQGSYYMAVRHRNHLGCMTAAPVALGGVSSPSGVNFHNPLTATWGTNARKVQGTAAVLWPGDVNGDGMVKYTGSANDRDLVLQAIGGVIPTNWVPNVYDRRDATLNGAITYTGGSSNDRDIILQTIGGVIPTATRVQQIP